MAEWISVKERLPELRQTDDLDILDGSRMDYKVSDEVLVCTDGEIDIGLLTDEGKGPIWVSKFYDGIISVTHWMPLPEPPEEGKTGD